MAKKKKDFGQVPQAMRANFSVGGSSPLLLHSAGLSVAERLHAITSSYKPVAVSQSTRLIFIKSDMVISAGFLLCGSPPRGKLQFWMMSPNSPLKFTPDHDQFF